MASRPQLDDDTPPPGPWVRLHEAPFDGQWIGLSADWASRLPCDPDLLAFERVWIQVDLNTHSELGRAIVRAVRAQLAYDHIAKTAPEQGV